MDEDTCMVDIAKFFLEFTVDDSIGKCTPCRVGTKRLLELLNKITEGRGTMEDMERIEELAVFIKENSLCGLGQTACINCGQCIVACPTRAIVGSVKNPHRIDTEKCISLASGPKTSESNET